MQVVDGVWMNRGVMGGVVVGDWDKVAKQHVFKMIFSSLLDEVGASYIHMADEYVFA